METKAPLEFRPLPSTPRPIQITVPIKSLYNLDQMQAITKGVLGKLGCPACHSGFDIRFKHFEDYVVRDVAGNIEIFEAAVTLGK